jgi:hypothetical protein
MWAAALRRALRPNGPKLFTQLDDSFQAREFHFRRSSISNAYNQMIAVSHLQE